jgi:AraC-like DNA-binding protein
MPFIFEEQRPSSPLIESIWRSESGPASTFTSLAVSRSEIVVTRLRDRTFLTVRGPETRATLAECPADAEFFGITLKLGSYLTLLPSIVLVNQHATLPEATRHSFWLGDDAWPFPDFGHADEFVERLIQRGLLGHEEVVAAVLQNELPERGQSLRSAQRRFLCSTGLSARTVRQIERARQAVALLEGGHSISDTVFTAGYSDQPHLTRALSQLAGRTPARIQNEAWPRSGLFTVTVDGPTPETGQPEQALQGPC